ncbi:MAG: S-layer homology domain-containing protein [Sedimentibacter sp.]|nr:S-layer homology domain-containing protein [Sedimentibacter sp.]
MKNKILIITILLLILTTNHVHAQGVEFYDIQNHWGKDYIETLVNEGGIVGYPDGTFKPDNLMKRGEFLKVVMSVLLGDDVLISYYGNDNTNSHWASYILVAAYDFGIVNEHEIQNTADSLETFITRYEMAKIFVRVDENILFNEQVYSSSVGNLIADYNKIPNEYVYFVEQAYLKGLIAGIDNKGTFAGSKTGTRAEASTMIVRLIDETYRVIINAAPEQPVYVPEIKEVSYTWEYPYGWVSWDWSLNISVEAVNIYRNIDRKYIYDYSFYVTHAEDDEYMNSLANVFVETSEREGMSDWEMIELATAFVQGLDYVPDDIGTGYDEYPKFPLETLYDQGGDCEDSSILLASLLRELGYGTVLVMTEDHMGVGVKASETANFTYMNMDFYYIETTAPGWGIGELPEELNGVNITILPVN